MVHIPDHSRDADESLPLLRDAKPLLRPARSARSCDVIDDCLRLFGGYGYMDGYPISRPFRDSRIDRIPGGAS